jgi:7-cyano-7-deazaguanine synthase
MPESAPTPPPGAGLPAAAHSPAAAHGSQAPLAIALLSGGLDSATAAALAIESGHRVIGLSFDYGQRHRRELQAAAAVAQHLGLQEHRVLQVDLAAWGGSSLTDASQALPVDGVHPDVIPSTYVPGRNTVFIALALSLAEATGAQRLVLGVNAVDYSGYPDCRPDYLDAFQTLADLATKAGREGRGVRLWAPLVEWDKPHIVREALRLGVPLEHTWSCYAGGDQPCGVCDSCRIRDAALIAVGRTDLAGLYLDRQADPSTLRECQQPQQQQPLQQQQPSPGDQRGGRLPGSVGAETGSSW